MGGLIYQRFGAAATFAASATWMFCGWMLCLAAQLVLRLTQPAKPVETTADVEAQAASVDKLDLS